WPNASDARANVGFQTPPRSRADRFMRGALLKPAEPGIGKIVSGTIGGPARRIHFPMRLYRDIVPAGLAASLPQITDQFLAGLKLRAGGPIAVKIAHQTDAEGNVVQIIAVHMAAIDLPAPAVAHLNLPVSCGGSVANHKMIRQTILHPADVPMIIIEHTRVALPRAAVVDHDEPPPMPFNRCAPDRFDDRTG